MNITEDNIPYLNRVYKKLVAEIGLENTLKVYELFGGSQVNFPLKLFIRDYTVSEIRRAYDGHNIRELADKFGYSERWIREILQPSLHRETSSRKSS